ncbi:MAG: hypothetical protein OXH11_14105 [Candidatus Aminicenantes bacterium]|nr:hypothetical protein [Candidatus Aminicenantes bacterium]
MTGSSRKPGSSTAYTGRRYTLVDSIAASVTPAGAGQVRSKLFSEVEKVRVSFLHQRRG